MDLRYASPSAEKHILNHEWKTPDRRLVRHLRRQGKTYGEITKETGVERSNAYKIVHAPSSKRKRKGVSTKGSKMKKALVLRIIKWVGASWDNRRQSWMGIRRAFWRELHDVSKTTIRRTLRLYGYRRCIACRRPFINKKQAARRLAFAIKYEK